MWECEIYLIIGISDKSIKFYTFYEFLFLLQESSPYENFCYIIYSLFYNIYGVTFSLS